MARLKKLAPFIFVLAWLAFCFWLYRQNLFSIHFGDEDDNFLLGKYLLSGQKLYSDLFAQHQPLGYVLSALVQWITHPTSIATLVTHQREFVWIWAAAWTGVAAIIFGWPVLLFSLSFELIKVFLFGDQFLSESLAIYPLLVIILASFDHTKMVSRGKFVLLGIAFATVALLLLPLWPALALLAVVLVYRLRSKIRTAVPWAILGGLLVFGLVLPFVDLRGYFHDSFYINNTYYLRYGVSAGEGVDVKAFFSPIIAWNPSLPGNEELWFVRILSLVLLVHLCYLIIGKRRFGAAIYLFFLLGLVGIRYNTPGKVFYNGFHMLPWVGVLALIDIYLSWKLAVAQRKVFFAIMLSVTILTGIWLPRREIFRRSDRGYNFQVNYSHSFDIASAIDILQKPGDTLFSAPGDWLVYWQVKTRHASFMLNYYGWMVHVPEIKSEVDSLFTNPKRLPTFFYCFADCQTLELGQYFGYYREIRKSSLPTGLFVIPQRLESLSEQQKQQLSYFNFNY